MIHLFVDAPARNVHSAQYRRATPFRPAESSEPFLDYASFRAKCRMRVSKYMANCREVHVLQEPKRSELRTARKQSAYADEPGKRFIAFWAAILHVSSQFYNEWSPWAVNCLFTKSAAGGGGAVMW